MSFLFARSRARLPLLTTLGLVCSASIPSLLTAPHRIQHLDSTTSSSTAWSYSRDAKIPVTKQGRLNPAAIRQISLGSILGVVCGLGLSTFSGSLTLVAGLLIAAVQAAEYNGIHIVPYKRLQNYISEMSLRSALQDNVTFKISFGMTLALTGFASFADYT